MIDWRMPGGTSEIARYLSGSFKAAFEAYWKKQGKPWDAEAAGSFDKPNATTDARKAFLESNVGIGVDVFFGGGAYDFAQQAAAGRLVDSGVIRDNPEWFEKQIPKTVSGELFYDPEGRWIGTVLSTFGICFNTDSMKRLGVETLTGTWADLTNPKFVDQVALADPTKSGSAAKAFEMIIQQKMQGAVIGAGLEANRYRAVRWLGAGAGHHPTRVGKCPLLHRLRAEGRDRRLDGRRGDRHVHRFHGQVPERGRAGAGQTIAHAILHPAQWFVGRSRSDRHSARSAKSEAREGVHRICAVPRGAEALELQGGYPGRPRKIRPAADADSATRPTRRTSLRTARTPMPIRTTTREIFFITRNGRCRCSRRSHFPSA